MKQYRNVEEYYKDLAAQHPEKPRAEIALYTRQFLSQAQVEQHLGLARGSLSRYKLPPPDAIIGPVDSDGLVPRGTIRGWTAETIDRWNAARPGRGARTDRR